MTQYNRHAIAPLDAIIPSIKASMDNPAAKMTLGAWTFNIHSLRLRTFCRDAYRNKLVCSCCGINAEYFAVESFKHGNSNSVHVNLYGHNDKGEEVLFTHDHSLARGLGGADNLSNTTTMCWVCNNKKGEREGHELNARRFIAGAPTKAAAHQKAILDAMANPLPPKQVEIALKEWAANMSTEDFTKRVDTKLQLFGWKRKELKEKINEGVINFTLHPVRD